MKTKRETYESIRANLNKLSSDNLLDLLKDIRDELQNKSKANRSKK